LAELTADPNQERQPAKGREAVHVKQLGFVFLVLFVVTPAACVYLSIAMSRRVQTAVNGWCNEERQALETQLRGSANADARMQIERWKQQHEQEIRLDAVQRSSAVTRGKVTEHIVPYLPGFDLNPKDIRFLGTPIDLIAFRGLNLWRLTMWSEPSLVVEGK
jgi:predicted Holliday junction resolvase-like endonuclease